MAIISPGSVAFSGFGDTPMKFRSPIDGSDLGQPTSAPVECGAGCDGVMTTSDGYVAVSGGNSPHFGTTGNGLFNKDLSFRAQGNILGGESIARDDNGNYYVSSGSGLGGKLYRFDNVGIRTATYDIGGQAVAIAVNGAGTIAYLVDSGALDTVRAWDLGSNTTLGTFATNSGFSVAHNGILAFTSGQVLVAWKKSAAPGYVLLYDAAGATVYTYVLGGVNPAPIVLAYGISAASFWVGYYDSAQSTHSSVVIAEIDLATSAYINAWAPDDGTFEFDGSFTILSSSTTSCGSGTGIHFCINNVEYAMLEPWTIQETQKAANTLTCTLVGNRIALDSEVIVRENGTRIFGGLVQTTREQPFEAGKSVQYRTSIEAIDFKALALRRTFNGRLVPDTVLNQLTAIIIGYLADYGVTLDPLQVTGPTTIDQSFDYAAVNDVLTKMTDDVNYVWEIDYNKVLRAYAPGTRAAPVDILDSNNNSYGPINAERSRTSGFLYANYVISPYLKPGDRAASFLVQFGGGGNFSNGETVTIDGVIKTFGTDVTVGANLAASLANLAAAFVDVRATVSVYVDSRIPNALSAWAVMAGSAGNSIAVGSSCAHARWQFGTIVQTVLYGGTDPDLSLFTVSKDDAEIASVGRYEFVIPANIADALTSAQAQALGDAYLAQHVITPVKGLYQSFVRELHPGQTQHITCAGRGVDDDFLITDVTITSTQDGIVSRSQVSAVLGSTTVDAWMTLYRQWSKKN